ncbi:hypothetical protein JHK87_007067 [Glycine soja]|nr:hypothetical protein JHK87_007067 [Glycine soja]
MMMQSKRAAWWLLRKAKAKLSLNTDRNLSSSQHLILDNPNLNQVLVEGNGFSRMAILNRPSALNALNTNMAATLHKLYRSWEEDPDIGFVMLKVALLNGITMGGGAGISIPGTFRVATDKTIFATPEVLIGFHPDAAASFYLSHLPGQLGEYLALTGEKLNGVEMVACGLATHYSSSARLPLIEEQLGKLVTDDPSVIETTLEQYGEIVHLDSSSVLQRIEVLDKCFCHDTVEEIVDAMENAASETNDAWCISTLNKLKEASPLSLKVALRSIREGRFQTLDQCLLREYRMTLQAIHRQISGDFCEWDPPTLEKVSQDMVDHYFLPLSESEPDLELPTNNREAFL